MSGTLDALAPVDPASPLGAALLAVEAERQRALIAADAAALDRLLAPELIHIHSSGVAQTKPEFLAHVARMGGFVSITRGALGLKAGGGFALITGPTVNTVRRLDSGALARLEGFGTVLARQTGEDWQIVLSQLTLFKNP